ncbi:hypothetical protein WH47_09353 [Habropoda laboriosa]|uniref:Uncharacterized protein n=1 Tax=Habropoda laboriosa TaxID=597456 RepID=A0A0L7REZ0_9HYME|nr:hypothetical protein WH47_09353 [Habropoda laboriosa]
MKTSRSDRRRNYNLEGRLIMELKEEGEEKEVAKLSEVISFYEISSSIFQVIFT